jgi:uncharacterized surface protein with fasciclin (FAS1) repeats
MPLIHVDIQQQCICSIQHKYTNLPRLVCHVLKKKNVFGTFIKNRAPWFQTCLMWQNNICQQKHILHYHIIRGHCNGKQVKHSCNMNLSTKHMWSDIIIIYTIIKN